MNQGCFPRDSGSRQGFYSRAGSHHLLQLQPLPKPRVTLGKCLEPSGKNKAVPSSKGKAEQWDCPRSQHHPRALPGLLSWQVGTFQVPQVAADPGASSCAPTIPAPSRVSGTGSFLWHSIQAGPSLLAGRGAFHPRIFFGIRAQDMVPLGCVEGT